SVSLHARRRAARGRRPGDRVHRPPAAAQGRARRRIRATRFVAFGRADHRSHPLDHRGMPWWPEPVWRPPRGSRSPSLDANGKDDMRYERVAMLAVVGTLAVWAVTCKASEGPPPPPPAPAVDVGADIRTSPGQAVSLTARIAPPGANPSRSEEHTSELQSPCNLVCRLLLE